MNYATELTLKGIKIEKCLTGSVTLLCILVHKFLWTSSVRWILVCTGNCGWQPFSNKPLHSWHIFSSIAISIIVLFTAVVLIFSLLFFSPFPFYSFHKKKKSLPLTCWSSHTSRLQFCSHHQDFTYLWWHARLVHGIPHPLQVLSWFAAVNKRGHILQIVLKQLQIFFGLL